MKKKPNHVKLLKKSIKLFDQPLIHLIVADIASLVALFLLVVIIAHMLTLTVNTLAPLATDLLEFQTGEITHEALTENILSYESLINQVFVKGILILAVGFFAMNALLSLFRGLAWAIMKNKKFTLRDFWQLMKVHLLYTGALLLIALVIGSAIKNASNSIGAVFITLFILLLVHFTPIMYSAFNPKISVWKNIKKLYDLGIKNIHHYLLFHVISLGIIFIMLIIIYLLNLITPILSSIALIIFLYTYWVWHRHHHIHLVKALQ